MSQDLCIRENPAFECLPMAFSHSLISDFMFSWYKLLLLGCISLIQCRPFITLCFESIGIGSDISECVINGKSYKGIIGK